MKTVYIGVGSNLGDSRKKCVEAIKKIGEIPGCTVIDSSPFYSTEPVGVEGHKWYVNSVISIMTNIHPLELIKKFLSIERDMGRKRDGGRWGSREIDLDILLYGEEIIKVDGLTVPHPLMHGRRFVMAPITDLAPDLIHPVLGKSMKDILMEIPEDEQMISIIEEE
jgi:2-amino-4-hydroxy-6-hydroxymethyldihydropteridine diphosphokinase